MKILTKNESELVTEQILKAEQNRTAELMPPNFEEATIEEGMNAANQIVKSFNKTVTELAHR